MVNKLRYWRYLFGGIGACLVGFLVFGGTVIKMFNDTDVLRNGIKTIGQVVDTSRFVETQRNGDRFQRYRVHFTYDANNSQFTNANTISKEAYERYKNGQSLEVYYYPNNPQESFVDMEGKIAQNRTQIIVGGAFAIGGMALLVLLGIEKERGEYD